MTPFTTDIFTVPFKDGYILYLPQLGIAAGVDKRVHTLVNTLAQGRTVEDNPFNRKWIATLIAMGAFQPQSASQPAITSEFSPTHVILSLTSHCHLRCVYCYASAGDKPATMDEEIMQAALTLVADNAKQNSSLFKVSFHGQGEPTANWSLFQHAIVFAKQLACERNLEVTFSMSTNAMWGHHQREFIAEHFKHGLSISFDGLPDIQNQQRPTAKNTPSFPMVFNNLKFLEEKKITYGIRATVLPTSVDAMTPFLDFVATQLACKTVHFEPVFATGRAAHLEMDNASFMQHFLKQYHQATVRGSELGMQVSYSGCQGGHQTTHFCGAMGPTPNFLVSTDGLVSSCYEIIDPHSPKGQITVYGYYDRSVQRFVFDEQKLQRIRQFSVEDLVHCKKCFARWNCAGDCLARADIAIDEQGKIRGSQQSPRCAVNRETTLYDLVRRAITADLISRKNSRLPTPS